MSFRLVVASVALPVILTGCASSGSPSAAPSSESAESRNVAIASCGVMGKMINGEIPINASTYSEASETLKDLAENGPGEVKSTARFVLDQIEGKEHTKSESEQQINKFKDYCRNCTVY